MRKAHEMTTADGVRVRVSGDPNAHPEESGGVLFQVGEFATHNYGSFAGTPADARALIVLLEKAIKDAEAWNDAE